MRSLKKRVPDELTRKIVWQKPGRVSTQEWSVVIIYNHYWVGFWQPGSLRLKLDTYPKIQTWISNPRLYSNPTIVSKKKKKLPDNLSGHVSVYNISSSYASRCLRFIALKYVWEGKDILAWNEDILEGFTLWCLWWLESNTFFPFQQGILFFYLNNYWFAWNLWSRL